MEDINSNTKNLYVIKRRLSELKFLHGRYIYDVGKFKLHIFPSTKNITNAKNLCLFDSFSCDLFEIPVHQTPIGLTKIISTNTVYATTDNRFSSLNIDFNASISLVELCELIKHLHRLSNLNAFT